MATLGKTRNRTHVQHSQRRGKNIPECSRATNMQLRRASDPKIDVVRNCDGRTEMDGAVRVARSAHEDNTLTTSPTTCRQLRNAINDGARRHEVRKLRPRYQK